MSLALALVLDAVFGEPRWLWSRISHPVILTGRGISWLEMRLNSGPMRKAKGALAITALCLAAVFVGAIIASLPLGEVWSALIAAIFLAHRSLIDHVAAVADALRISLPDARQAVAQIVGRETAEMTEAEVARAAIESAAENFSDGVVAPAFWFALAGLPGILLYKAVNTADSMIGYKTEQYREFGWAAARLDDLLNYVPARLTAALIAIAHANPDAWHLARREAPAHRSPNAGWPEAAMAAQLGVALSGPRTYGGQREDHPFVNDQGAKMIGPDQIDAALKVLWRSWWVMLGLALLVGLVS